MQLSGQKALSAAVSRQHVVEVMPNLFHGVRRRINRRLRLECPTFRGLSGELHLAETVQAEDGICMAMSEEHGIDTLHPQCGEMSPDGLFKSFPTVHEEVLVC